MPNKKKRGFNRSMDSTIKPLQNHNHSATRKQRSEEQMKGALNFVLEDGISANKAAVIHGVTRSTLKDQLSGCIIHGQNLGPDPYLSVDEEKELATHLANIGYGKTRKDYCATVCGKKRMYLYEVLLSLMAGGKTF